MFRLILIQTKKPPPKPINLSTAALTSTARSKTYFHCRSIGERNSGSGSTSDGSRISSCLHSCIFEHATKRFPLKISNLLPFHRNYSTDIPIGATQSDNNLIKNDINDIIDELSKKSIENGNRLSQYELKTLFHRIRIQKPTAEQALQILQLCSLGRIDLNVKEIVKSIWRELHSADAMNSNEFDTQHYNYVLKFASDRHDVNYTQAVFDEMIADSIQPNAISYEYLMSVYCKTGNIEKTNEILNMMDESQLPLSERAYNYMIQCFIISGTVNDANALIEKANNEKTDKQFNINHDTLTTVLNLYAKSCDLENCQKTFEIFNSLNIKLLNSDILNLMCQFCINGRADQCNSLFHYFKSNSEMQTALYDAVTLFVQNNQSLQFMKILQKLKNDGVIKDNNVSIYKHLIDEMCRQNTPEHEFEATTELIESSGFQMEKNFDSFKSALKCSSPKLIRKILLHMKANGIQVTEMSFERLFELAATGSTQSKSNALKEDDILNVVNLMCVDFKIQPGVVYIRDVILPAILKITTSTNNANSKDSTSIIAAAEKLQKTEIHHHRTLNALINSSLNRCDFKTAIYLLNSRQCFYAKKFITEALLTAYASTGDVSSFIEISKIISQSFAKFNDYHVHYDANGSRRELSAAEIKQRQIASVDEMFTSAVAHSLADDRRLTKLLDALVRVDNELMMSSKQIKKIQQKISDSLDLNHRTKEHHMMQIDRLLKNTLDAKDHENLSEGSAAIETTNWRRQDRQNAEHLSADEIKQTLGEQRAMGRDVTGTEKSLFLAYLREENIPEVEAMLSGATQVSGKFNLTQANYGMLIKLYIRRGDLDKALKYLKQACEKYLQFKLYPIQLGQLITLMYEQGNRFNMNEIDALLHIHRQDKMLTNQNIPFEQLLQRLAADGNAEYVQQLFDTLVKFHYIQPTPETAGPLVKVHLNNGAYDLAVQKYGELAKTYKFLPMSGTLFKTLIQNKQTDLLKRALEIHGNFCGKSAAMSHLAFAYSELGQIQQAKEIFESNQINDLTKDIGKTCMRYARKDDLESAKFLLKSTTGILTCDRRIIYQTILDFYHKHDMADAALELWLTMSNDYILATPNFLDKLAKLLQTNHIELPSNLRSKIQRQNC